MKKICKSVAVLFVMSMLLSWLTGCAVQNKMELLNAIEKTAEIRSYENNSSFEFQNVTMDSTIEETAGVEPFISMLNGLKMDIRQQVSQNNEKTILKSQLDMAVTLQGTTENTSIWMDYDYTKTPPKMRNIIKMPAFAIGMVPGADPGKEYLDMDGSLLENPGGLTPENYTDSLESVKNFQTQILDLIKQYAIEENPNFVAVTQLPDRTINGENHKVYQLKLTDSSLKALLKYMATKVPHNNDTKEMLKEFILATMMMIEGTEAGKDLNDTFEKFRDGTTTFSQDLNKTLEAFDDITILGNQGIVIDYWINSQGYIVSQDGIIDLYMNTQQVDNALEKLSPTGNYPASNKAEFLKAKATLTLNFSSKTSRINEDIAIEFPILTPENTINFSDIGVLSKTSTKILRKQGDNKKALTTSKSIKANSKAFKYNVKPLSIGEHIIFPIKEVCKNLGVTYKENKEGSYSITNDKNIIRFTNNSYEITVNKAFAVLSFPVIKIKNRLFVPQEFVERYLHASIILNRKDHTAAVIPTHN